MTLVIPVAVDTSSIMDWTCTRLSLAIPSLLVASVDVIIVLLHLRFRALCTHGFLACGLVSIFFVSPAAGDSGTLSDLQPTF